MHRAITRVIRGTCRKWRENECPPVLAGEDVRKNNKQEDFVPPKHSWNEAVGWTTGLVLAWQLTHHRRAIKEERPPGIGLKEEVLKKCPFGLAKQVVTQPVVSTVNNVKAQTKSTTKHSYNHKQTSIAITPFLKEDFSSFDDNSLLSLEDSDDDEIQFKVEEKSLKLNLKPRQPLSTEKTDENEKNVADLAGKVSADLFSVLGSFKFLSFEQKNGKQDLPLRRTDPPIHALELMKKGAELGSSRALYNIGVAYDRMNEPKLALEYYKRASDLGHPIATYNTAVFCLRDGRISEGLQLTRIAADKGVQEAKEILNEM